MATNSQDLDLTVLLPVFNEEEALPAIIQEIKDVLDVHQWAYEILVIDDGSTDKTLEIAEMISNNDSRMVQGLKKLASENIGYTLKEQYNHEMRAVQDWLKPISVQDSFKTFLDKKGRI